jgi:EAL domain-containing protein (putative c-di-GMP-specific phosphodiesterase class I)
MSVSDDRSVELLQEFGVDYVQGFHIERPYRLEEAR